MVPGPLGPQGNALAPHSLGPSPPPPNSRPSTRRSEGSPDKALGAGLRAALKWPPASVSGVRENVSTWRLGEERKGSGLGEAQISSAISPLTAPGPFRQLGHRTWARSGGTLPPPAAAPSARFQSHCVL